MNARGLVNRLIHVGIPRPHVPCKISYSPDGALWDEPAAASAGGGGGAAMARVDSDCAKPRKLR